MGDIRMMGSVRTLAAQLATVIAALPDVDTQVAALNAARKALHDVSPLRHHPVDFVEWTMPDGVRANDYNPNNVAAPEFSLLIQSIRADGYTQPVVTWPAEDTMREVIDGFHRNRVVREVDDVRASCYGYLPIVTARSGQTDTANRMAATIRHNRARGKHQVNLMTDIIIALARKGWDNIKIGKELGMDPDEVLRFKQVSGLAALFAEDQFSEAWEPA